MKIKENSVKVDDTCKLEVSVTRLTDDGVTLGTPLVLISKDVQGVDDRSQILLTPKQAIDLAKMIRECGKEAYAWRIEEG